MSFPMPEFVDVGPYTIPIINDASEMKRERREYNDPGIQGLFRSTPHVIILDPDTDLSRQRSILLHEVRHAVWAYLSMDLDVNTPTEKATYTEEEVIRRETPALLDTLRRNPDLVQFIMDTAIQ